MELNVFPVMASVTASQIDYVKDYILPIILNVASIFAAVWIARKVFVVNHEESLLRESVFEANRFILFVSELQQHFINMKDSYFDNLESDCFNRVYAVPNAKEFTPFNSFDPSKFVFLIPTLESKFKNYTHMSPVSLTNLLQNSFEVDRVLAIREPLYSEFRDVFSRNYTITDSVVHFDKQKIITEFGKNRYSELVDYTERYICYADRILLTTESIMAVAHEVFTEHFGKATLKKYGPLLQLGEHPKKYLIIQEKPVDFEDVKRITSYPDLYILNNYITSDFKG